MLLVICISDARKTGKLKLGLHLRNSVSTTKMPKTATMRAMGSLGAHETKASAIRVAGSGVFAKWYRVNFDDLND